MSYFGSIYADQELSHRAKTVYMYLKDRSNADSACWPSVRRIAEDLKLSRRTVQRALWTMLFRMQQRAEVWNLE